MVGSANSSPSQNSIQELTSPKPKRDRSPLTSPMTSPTSKRFRPSEGPESSIKDLWPLLGQPRGTSSASPVSENDFPVNPVTSESTDQVSSTDSEHGDSGVQTAPLPHRGQPLSPITPALNSDPT